jgi:hypothetical protein
VETQAHRQCRLLNLGLDQIKNAYTAWMGPLVRVVYSGLNQSVLRLDRVKSYSCDYQAKFPEDV